MTSTVNSSSLFAVNLHKGPDVKGRFVITLLNSFVLNAILLFAEMNPLDAPFANYSLGKTSHY